MAKKRHRLDKFGGDEWNFSTVQCNDCANYNRDGTCLAFPKGIPRSIIIGETIHDKPVYYQDNTIIFEKLTLDS